MPFSATMTPNPSDKLPCDRELLSRYLDSTLSVDEQTVLECHLNECESCRSTIETLAADAEFWNAATEALDSPNQLQIQRAITDLSLSALRSLTNDSETRVSGLNYGETPTESILNQTQLLQRWLDPSDRKESLGRIGKYEVLGVLGQGGMGLVLKAHDTELERMVAIKTLPHQVTSRTDARLRLAREARAAAGLRHPNIVSVFGLETWRDVPLIVMPLVEGGTLQQYAAKQRLATEQVLVVGLQIAEALSALHAEGIVHRDLKPSNILLQDQLNHVLLSDFGLARFDGDLAITHSDALAGTPFFMSPEQAQGKPIDARSDLFSFGSVLYWMCTGQYPFRGNSSYETLSQLIHSKANSEELARFHVPMYLRRLVDRLLAKEPSERWSSAEEVAELLRACVVHYRSPAEPLPPSLMSQPKLRILSRWQLRSAASLLVLGCSATGLAMWYRYARPVEVLQESSERKPAFASQSLPNEKLRYGALDELDRRAMQSDLERGNKIHYWLRRLAYLPVEEIPPESIPAVQLLTEHSDLAVRELSQVVLNKNPFQEILVLPATMPDSSTDENPFQEVLPDE